MAVPREICQWDEEGDEDDEDEDEEDPDGNSGGFSSQLPQRPEMA